MLRHSHAAGFRLGPRRIAGLLVTLTALGCAASIGPARAAVPPSGATSIVGRQSDGTVLLPDGQRIRPAGTQIELPGSPTGVAIAPDGRTAVIHRGGDGGSSLAVISLPDGRVLQDGGPGLNSASFAGIAYSPDGRHVFSSDADGTVSIIDVRPDGTLGPARTVTIPRDATKLCCGPYPGGLAASADGRTLYVALSVNNTLGVIDVASATLVTQIPVGNAPHSVLVDGNRAFVTDEGGRPVQPGDFFSQSAGTPIVADPFTAAATTGAVSVVDLTAQRQTAMIPVGVHPTAMALGDGRLFVAATDADTVSEIDPATLAVTRTLHVSPDPATRYGSMPNGLALLPGATLAVTLGRDDATELISLRRPAHRGLIPVGWFPADVAFDPVTRQLVVANNQGIGSLGDAEAGRHARGVGSEIGTVSLIRPPGPGALAADTREVGTLNGWNPSRTESESESESESEAESASAPSPIPAHLGDPSPIRHVVYIVRENRTYDQVLGDIGRGDSDPSLVNYGETVTPNAHALARTFPLLDNFYDSGRRSNDGHQWAMGAQNPDYFQKADGNDKRSDLNAPSSGFDSLLYTPSGFLWEDALAHGRSLIDFGEYTKEDSSPPAYSDIPSLEAHVVPTFPGFQLNYPDQLRARDFATHLAGWQATGRMPNLVLMTLPNDHTGGNDPFFDTPQAEVADNDAALGRIVDSISHSRFWASTAIFVAEDDAQGGVDHVDGHRSVAFVISPYARRGVVDSEFASQVSMVRTIEQILGLPPMNHLDAAARPMLGAFTATPDLTPFDALAPRVGTNIPNPPLSALTGLRREWAAAMLHQDWTHFDAVDPALLRRDLWYAARGFDVPFPGDRRVLHPWEVPAAPGSGLGDG